MSDNKPSLRIDWFDGTLVEDTRPSASVAKFEDEDQPEVEVSKPQVSKNKPIGFKRLLELSFLEPPILTLEISHRPGFWNLMEEKELSGDFIVRILSVLAKIYDSLEPGENSKITRMLDTRFVKSFFFNNLKKYTSSLPSVRVVEKRKNSHLWDDVEAFYFNVLKLCEGIVNFGVYNNEFLRDILDFLEDTELSALGVCEEHTETINEDFFIHIQVLKKKIMEQISVQDLSDDILAEVQVKDADPDSFRNLNVFPTKDDLLGNNEVKFQPNIVNGSYPNIEHYLDIQFKLLREDCFGPLREGITKYIENPAKRRYENIRVHPKVRIIRTYVSNNKVGHLVDIAWQDRINQGLISSKKYAYSKQLMFGSLLLFTSDNFNTILCATVLDSNLELLRGGYLAVSFENPVSKEIFSQSYLMVESEVFFEPYHRVLKVLQNSRTDNLPMKRYIVDVQKETHNPAYLNHETIYTVKNPNNGEELPFPVLDTEQWPTDVFNLDNSQLEAFKFALTREFAVIQGPPGTGKTFLGVKIASTILKNLSLEGTPMLIICYTNHALDQFLEGLLDTTQNIIRLGSQSKSKVLEPYSLNNARYRLKSKYSHLYASKRGDLEKIYKQMTDLQTEIEKCEREILCYKCVKSHFNLGDKSLELKACKQDPVLNWLFEHLDQEQSNAFVVEDDWEQLDNIPSESLETCFSEQWALKEIDSMLNSVKYVKDISDEHFEGQKMTDQFESQIDKVRKRLNCFKKCRAKLQNCKKEEKNKRMFEKVTDLYELTTEDRWSFYYEAAEAVKNELLAKMDELLDQHNTTSRELEEVSTLTDGEVMKRARVVGVTTTAAARRHKLITALMAPVVIVEEAAEVLEAHIVASLSNHCQHLVLIGDHKQLRPTAAHYKLAKQYNFEISLFERMIHNGVHSRTLSTQRRMRPDFVELLVPIIYERLDSHQSVYKYSNIKGMVNNLYFYTHNVLEDSEGLEDSWSHKNIFEAKWCVALANYLRQMDYQPHEITILATYTGQVSTIKEYSKNYKLLRDIKITAVDNYQGEESRIVILSLVRSNRDGKIGFLAAANRICVALSRAKEGFYMFGNMNILKSSSAIWRFINDKLSSRSAIGQKLTLRCETHRDNVLDVVNFEDLDHCLQASCLKSCEFR